LEEAIIENNRLTKIPESISKMTNLNAITFKSNKIVAVPPMIGQLPKLKALNLSFNAITKIPNEIGQIKTLTSLNFAWNQIAEIPPALKELKSLQFLWLDKNLLKEIPEFISELNLSTLSLAENQLSTLPYHLWVMDGLQTLKLEKNPLSTEEQQMTQNDAQTIRNYCRQRACISVMLIYTEADKVNHRISEIIEFLENQKEIYTVLQPEILNLPSTDLLLFLTTAGSIKSPECLGILKTAKDQGISVVPLKGLDIGWGDLAGIGLSRELGHEFTPKDFTGFCGRVYEYIQRFKRTHNIFKDKRAIVLKEREKPGDPSSFVMFKEVILQLFQSNEMKTYFSMLKDSLASDYERSLKGQNNEVIFFNQMLMYLAAFMGQQRDAQQSSKGGF
jgi:hypothetical protein